MSRKLTRVLVRLPDNGATELRGTDLQIEVVDGLVSVYDFQSPRTDSNDLIFCAAPGAWLSVGGTEAVASEPKSG